jgi:hypothetical protein
MKKALVTISFIVLCNVFAFAQVALYAPRALVIQVHTEANQFYASGGYAHTLDHGGVDVNLSYSFARSFAVFGSATYNPFEFSYKGEESFLKPQYHYNYNNLSTAFGVEYFKSGLNGLISVVEAQLGFGYSSHDKLSYAMHEGFLDKKTEYDYTKIFLQLSATKIFEDFDISLALRTTHVNYGYFKEYELNGSEVFEDNGLESKFFFEPSISGSYKIKGIKLNLQMGGYAHKSTTANENFEETTTESVLFSRIAVQYSF